MSDFGTCILKRLHTNSPAVDEANPFHKVFGDSVGEWLDHFDVNGFHEMLFLNDATGEWLDVHGEQFGVPRHLDEEDGDYRTRIIQHTLGRLTPVLLNADFGLDLYSSVSGFSLEDNVLVSDNYYIGASDGYTCFTSVETRDLILRGFVINEVVEWFVR